MPTSAKLRRTVCWYGTDSGVTGTAWRSTSAASASSRREVKFA